MLYGPTKVNILRAFCFLMWKIVYGLKCKHVSAWSWAWSWWPGVMLLLSQPGHWTRPPCGHFDLNIQRRINGSGEMILGLVLTPRVAQLAGGLEWPLIWDKLLALKHKRARHADYAVFVSSLPDVWCHMIHDILSCVRPGTQASLSFSTSSFLTYCHDGALQAWRLCNRLSSLLHFTTSHQLRLGKFK